jgi:NifB/MoaA-like Fe-S oxidoreductase
MESVALNLLISVAGVFFSAVGTAWKIQRHFDERVDQVQLSLMSANADQRVERTRMDGEVALLRSAIEGSIERNDHRLSLLARDVRDLQGWLAKHHRYTPRGNQGGIHAD